MMVLGRDEGAGLAAAPSTLVIAPFQSPADPSLGAGLANAITVRLGGQQLVAVRAIRANGDVNGAGLEWPSGATHALNGEITSRGAQVDVQIRLQDSAGIEMWSDRIQVRADELFSLEDVIAERVVSALRLRLAAAEQQRLRRRYTENHTAYGHYLRGRAALVLYTPEGTRAAVDAFAPARAGAALASILAAHGDARGSQALIDDVLKGDYRDHHVAYSLGAAYAQLGDMAAAGRWLRTAADTGFPCVPFFERDPLLEVFRRRPEFADLISYVRQRRDSAMSTVSP